MNFAESRPRSLFLLPLLIAAFALAACGDDDGDGGTASLGGPDPRELVPADAPIYFEAVVDPDSDQLGGLNEGVARVAGVEDAIGLLEAEIEGELEASGSEISYSEDIEPLLDGRAGFFVSGFPQGFEESEADLVPIDGAAIIGTDDPEAALELVKTAIEEGGDGFEDATYEDVDYIADPDDDTPQRGAAGIVGDFLIFGTESGLQAVVDADAGEGLAGDEEATSALDGLDAETIVSGFFDFGSLFELATASGDLTEEDVAAAEQYFGGPVEGTGSFGVAAGEDGFSFEFSAPADLQPTSTADGDAIESLPADAWFAFAASDVGTVLTEAFGQFEAALETQELPGLEGEIVSPEEIEDELGLDPASDLGWIGDIRGFVSGESLFGLGAGIAVESTDEAAATEALKALAQGLRSGGGVDVTPIDGGYEISSPEAPIGAKAVLSDGNLVLAGGAVDENDVLDPAEALGDSEQFNDAVEALGDDYAASFFLDFEAVTALVDSLGESVTAGDPEAAMVLDALGNLDYLVLGSQADDERITVKGRLGLSEDTDE